ncbi:MAG: anthranilate synthase component I family protein, partial [bacterium]
SFPELVVQMENGVVKNFPIAGTRHRGKNAAEDKEIAKGLLKDEKELAEHMMLIDLGRNDLGRICEFGSVKVAKKMIIKKFSHVMHICSEIHGKILKNKDMFDALAVSMPMGTVSGAPKVRAMELINKYEKTPRGPYAGSIGYFSLNGDCKLTAGLRAIFISKGIGSIRAGAGLVYDSQPDYEFNETENKMRGMRRVVER